MYRVVVSTVFELVAYPPTHLKVMARRDGHVTSIKQTVNVATKEKSVSGFVDGVLCIWPNMCCIKRGKRFLTGDGATPLVIISDDDPKRALAQTRSNQGWLAPSGRN